MVIVTLRKSNLKVLPVILGIFLFVIMSISIVQGAVLSIDQANIRSSYFGFDEAWIVSLVSDDYTTDSLNAYLTPQAIEDASGYESEQALQISVNTKPNYCTYSFKTNTFNYQDVYTVEPIKISKWLWTKSDVEEFKNMIESQCADFSKPNYKVQIENLDSDGSKWDAGDYVYGDTSWILEAHAFCVKLNEKIGTIAQPIDKRIIAETDWTVGVEGKTPEVKTISNSETGEGRNTKLGDNVWVQWQGNLGTGEDCPDVSNLIGVHDNSFSNGWRFGSRDDYYTYSSYLTNRIKQDIREYAESSYPEDYQGLFRNRANAIINNVVDEESGFSYSILDTSYYSGKVRVDLGRQIVFPLFKLIIDADYLEIVIPTGEPSIVSVSDIEFTEGLAGQVTAVIKNKGDGKGGFTTRIKDCTNGFSSSTAPTGSILDAGETDTLYFNVIGSSTVEQAVVSGVCTLEVKESTTGEVATKIFGAKMNQLQQCIPGTMACSVDDLGKSVVKECNNAGTKYEIVETCPESQECRLTVSGAKCVDKDDDDDFYCEDCDAYANNLIFGKIFESQECNPKFHHNSLFCIMSILKLFAIPFIFIISLILGVQTLNKLLGRQYMWLSAIIGTILSLLIAMLTYIFFWLGVVILIIYGIFRVALNFIPGLNVVRRR
ncbi:MAG: hypothetical protein U9Q73_00355 [Nanoarchaeota archaeon]|nr:hypothetical protein [Nanoarchaeota archaeon]